MSRAYLILFHHFVLILSVEIGGEDEGGDDDKEDSVGKEIRYIISITLSDRFLRFLTFICVIGNFLLFHV